MRLVYRTLAIFVVLLSSIPSVRAQTPADPSGHWEGAIQAAGLEMRFAVDLEKNSQAVLIGTLSVPAEHINGIPLRSVATEGKSVSFYARKDQSFTGTLSDDGTWIVGEAKVGEYSPPFTLHRTGDAHIDPPVRSAPISKDLEGSWNGTLAADGKALRVVLTLSNQPDGTSTGMMVNLDEGELQIPIRITQKGASVTLENAVMSGSYAATLNAAGTELVGTYTQGPLSAPLAFVRVQAAGGR